MDIDGNILSEQFMDNDNTNNGIGITESDSNQLPSKMGAIEE